MMSEVEDNEMIARLATPPRRERELAWRRDVGKKEEGDGLVEPLARVARIGCTEWIAAFTFSPTISGVGQSIHYPSLK